MLIKDPIYAGNVKQYATKILKGSADSDKILSIQSSLKQNQQYKR